MSEFLAEAKVLVRPDTKAFGIELAAELKAIQATLPPIVVPVTAGVANVAGAAAAAEGVAAANTAVAVSSTAAGAAVTEQAVETAVLGAEQTKASIIAANFAKAQSLGAAATARLAGAAQAAALTTSELAGSRAILRETSAAVALAERAVGAALVAGNVALIGAAENTLALAKSRQAEATTAVEAAIAERGLAAAQTTAASRMSAMASGAATTTLTMAGLRGAAIGASGPFLAAAVAVTAFAKAIRGAAGLEQELNVFRITAQATGNEMARVSEEATRLGADISLPGVSSRDAAESMTELAKAGLDVRDSIGGARGVLQLAAAAQISNAEATELAANALNAFGLSGVEAVHVADLLANAANNAQGSISDMGLALRQSAAVARQVGFSIEDTAALLTLLAKNGLTGSDAGTALRTSLIRLINPTTKAKTAIASLGLELRDAQGNLRPEVFAEFAEATSGMSRAQQDATAALVFGQDAIRAQAILGREGASGLDAMRIALDRQGAAAELAGARAQGFSGQMSALSSNLETLGTTLGGFVLPGLSAFLSVLNDIASDANAVVGGIKAITGEVSALNEQAKETTPVLEQVEDRLVKMAIEQAKWALLGGPNIAARGVIFAAQEYRKSSDSIGESTEEIGANVRDVIASLQGPIGSTDLNAAVLALQEMADKLAAGDAEARQASRALKDLIKEIQNVGGLPSPVVEILMKLNKAGLKTEATSGAQIILDAMTASLSPATADALGFGFMEQVGSGMKRAAPAAGSGAGQILVQSMATQLSVAEATGSDSQILSVLRQREAKQAAFLQKILERPQDAKTQALVREAAANLEQTQNQIQGILDKQASDAQEAKNKAATARNEADQAILDSVGTEEQRRQNALLRAQSTESLKDDIKRGAQLRDFYKRAIEEVRKTVQDATVAAQQIASLVSKKIAADQKIDDAKKALVEARKAERREARERLRESLALDVQIAQATGNRAREIRSREAEIQRIKDEIDQTRKGSLQRKRLILELRQKQKELHELAEEKKGEKNAFGELAFQFLQTQQGFAANLLGNLIPGFATGGLVGESQSPTGGTAIQTPATGIQAQSATRMTGPTFGQTATQESVLKQIYQVLVEIRNGRSHPEAHSQRAQQHAVMDFGSGGSGGQSVY